MTGSSTLDPDNFPSANEETGMGAAGGSAVPDLGDANLDRVSDSNGTGERAAAWSDPPDKSA